MMTRLWFKKKQEERTPFCRMLSDIMRFQFHPDSSIAAGSCDGDWRRPPFFLHPAF